MSPLIAGSIFDIARLIIERIAPDSTSKAKAEAEFLTLIQTQSFQTVLAQLEVNAKEAQHPNIWVSGWRPFAGWICGTGLLYSSMLHPLLSWLAAIKGWPLPPTADTEVLWVVLTGMLGIGTFRTIEKSKGVSK